MGEEEELTLNMPPPAKAEFSVKVLLVILGEELALYMPPPLSAEIGSLLTVRLPPRSLLLLVMVKPSMSAAVPNPKVMTTV